MLPCDNVYDATLKSHSPVSSLTPLSLQGALALELHALLTSGPASSSAAASSALRLHPLIAFDAWQRLGDHHALRRPPPSSAAAAAYAAALAAFSDLEDGCCDGYSEFSAKLDHRTFVSYWADLALVVSPPIGAQAALTAATATASPAASSATAAAATDPASPRSTAAAGTSPPTGSKRPIPTAGAVPSNGSSPPTAAAGTSSEVAWAAYVPGAVFLHR